MEENKIKASRLFRSKENILNILAEHRKSNLSIHAFCLANNIASASFHNWKKRYGSVDNKLIKQPGFTPVQIIPSTSVETGLFAEVNGIRIFQRVDAGYLKELQS